MFMFILFVILAVVIVLLLVWNLFRFQSLMEVKQETIRLKQELYRTREAFKDYVLDAYLESNKALEYNDKVKLRIDWNGYSEGSELFVIEEKRPIVRLDSYYSCDELIIIAEVVCVDAVEKKLITIPRRYLKKVKSDSKIKSN